MAFFAEKWRDFNAGKPAAGRLLEVLGLFQQPARYS
jgi:hypothetical protein